MNDRIVSNSDNNIGHLIEILVGCERCHRKPNIVGTEEGWSVICHCGQKSEIGEDASSVVLRWNATMNYIKAVRFIP